MTALFRERESPERELARRLLDRDTRDDRAARRTINEALREGSTDPVVHAAALWLPFSARADLRLGRSSVRNWTFGLHELIHSGHLDAADYALPQLLEAFPDVPYLTTMADVFRQLPPVADNGREPFVDDRDSDVQVVRTPLARTSIVAFCGGHHQLGMPMNLLDRWFGPLDAHLIYLRDRRKVGFTAGIPALGADLERTSDALNQILQQLDVENVVSIGNSSGGAGAIRYAHRLNVVRVLALSPITGGPEYAAKVAPHLKKGVVNPWGDLAPLYQEGAGVRTHILYGEKNEGDRQQSLRMAGLPGVTLEPVIDWQAHHLIHGLLKTGRLNSVLAWLSSGDDYACLGPEQSKAMS